MIQKILIGILAGIFIGIVVTSFFATKGTNLIDLFLTQITATSMITGVLCGIYTHYSKTKLRKFIFSVGIGILIFQTKYFITGKINCAASSSRKGFALGAVVAAWIGSHS